MSLLCRGFLLMQETLFHIVSRSVSKDLCTVRESYCNKILQDNAALDWHPIQEGSSNTPCHFMLGML